MGEKNERFLRVCEQDENKFYSQGRIRLDVKIETNVPHDAVTWVIVPKPVPLQ